MSVGKLTKELKNYARKLGADLVGIAPVQRWEKAPIEHSPQGIFPDAKFCIVCGIHIPDACVELGAEEDPRKPGPGLIEANVSVSLNFLASRIAKYLQDKGWLAIPIPVTGYWRYRPNSGAPRGWIGDICHYYAAVAAGLGEIGWHNLCITPEFGARQRFISIITNALLNPDPIYNGEPLCDKCLLCAKHCPTKSFDKEVNGMCEIEIEKKKFSFPNRNLWRCAVGENFQLDVLLPLPDKIDEKIITEMEEKALREHPEWIYGWKMGICLKYCLPPNRRYFDRNYCKSPRRKRDVIKKEISEIMNEVLEIAQKTGIDIFATGSIEDFKKEGVDLKTFLPDAESAIVLGLSYPENCHLNTNFLSLYSELLIANHLEKYGFSVLAWSNLSSEIAALACGIAQRNENEEVITKKFGKRQIWRAIITSARIQKQDNKEISFPVPLKNPTPPQLTKEIKRIALSEGADLFGIASTQRLNGILPSLRKTFEKEDYFIVEDAPHEIKGINVWGGQAWPYNPIAKNVKLIPKGPGDYLNQAKSIIVIGMHLSEASIEYAGKPPAQKAGHYQCFIHGEVFNQISCVLLKIAKFLDESGYKVFPSFDLCNLASRVYGGSFDLTASRFAAVCAGLGEIGWNGIVLTPEFGPKQRFATLITDALLEFDSIYNGPPLCKRCFKCLESCSVQAISKNESFSFEIEGKKFEWGKVDRLRCDWVKRYGLLGEGGPKFMGSHNNFKPPQVISEEKVCQAIQESDRLQRPGYTSIVERCFTSCSFKGMGSVKSFMKEL